MQQPLYILTEDTQRTQGRSAQDSNIRAGKAVANAVRTTLGPRGMDKMLVDASGTVVVTNDGATILGEMDIEHPAAQMIVEVAETQEESVGDGTTTAAVLAGELLVRAEDLLDGDLHPTVVVEGYDEAAGVALAAIDELVLGGEGSTIPRGDGEAVDLDDDLLARVAESSMTGKGTGDVSAEALAERVVAAVRHVTADSDIDRDSIHITTHTGASSSATRLIEGVVVDKDPVVDAMPRSVSDATVAVVDVKLDVRKSAVDTEYSITSVDQLDAALDAEETELRGYASALADAGVDVLFCTKKIDDRVASHLARAGILAFGNVKGSDATAIARAVGARRLGTVADVDPADLGHADAVDIERFGGDDLVVVEGGAAAAAVTLLLRGGTEHVVDELERAVTDAVDGVVAAVESGGVVPGAGATEIAVASRVRDAASRISGRKQLAVEAFADAVEALPRTLAENTGMDPIDAMVDLRTHHEREGRAGIIAGGRTGVVDDPVEYGIFDPAAVKRAAVGSAAEAATMILRIDDVIAAR
ncbi:thermosome subunit [Haloplanus rubicundus]|uniref:Thermosome subunit n=1 Tax=Haloplanus rubicundus TaxID=1547898 RepID=A0A345E2Q5_9EURY|nr:thermosome subunit alpha [Haloplanus rubicundus]AXG06477.1 thermosome subunit [Haloplanus rubicundus]